MERAMEEKLIECVRAHECLFNNKSEHYKNASLKQDVWDQIATELNIPASECKIKWNLLRNSFGHALSRRKSVTGNGVKNFKKWKWKDEMSFLLPFMAHRNTISNINDVEQGQSSSAIVEETNENENVTQRKRKDNNNYYQEEILNLMKARSEKREKNDLDLFFLMMAQTVKKFPKSEQVKLKFEIMKMVHEVEIRCLDSVSESSGSSRLSVTSTPSPPLFNCRTSSPYFRQQSASPQIAQQSSSPNTLEYSSPQYVPQPSPSPPIAQQSSSPNTLPYSSPQYVPQPSPSPPIAQQSSSPNTLQYSSLQNVPQSSPSPQIIQQLRYSATQQVFSPQYLIQPPPPSHYDTVVEVSIPSPRNDEASEIDEITTSRQSYTCYEGPASILKEFLIMKKR